MSRRQFEAAAARVVVALGPSLTKDLAGLLTQGRGRDHALAVLGAAAVGEAVVGLYEAAETEGVPHHEAAAYLRGYVAGSVRKRDQVRVQTVWSGPSTSAIPVRATAQVLTQVVGEAQRELLAMTYAARPYAALTRALTEAVARGVEVHVVVETLAGAGGLLSGPEPADAFAPVRGITLWQWATDARSHVSARQHAKLAVADARVLFVGSANLTESAAQRNLEAGVLVSGGAAPARAAEHIKELQRRKVLRPLEPS